MKRLIFLIATPRIFKTKQENNIPKITFAFFTAKNAPLHISFVHEANQWFAAMTQNHSFSYDSTSNWNNLHTNFISAYQVLIFSDTRPDPSHQLQAFQQYMENGGAWMGFHFSAFA